MSYLHESVEFRSHHERMPVGIDEKVTESLGLLGSRIHRAEIRKNLTSEAMLVGEIPRLSPFDIKCLPKDVVLVEIPIAERQALLEERSYDLIRWNKPDKVLQRLRLSKQSPTNPDAGLSRVMDRVSSEGKVVSFEDLRVESPQATKERQSRSKIVQNIESTIMGEARIPFALGSVPDVGSILAYVTMAQAHGMAFVSRDKILGDIDKQAEVVKRVVSILSTVTLPRDLMPSGEQLQEFSKIMGGNIPSENLQDKYMKHLRKTWIANVGAAIEASPKGIKRAQKLYEAGCRMFRIYSPEGGLEIIKNTRLLREEFANDSDVRIVGGQIMDVETARKAEDAGCDALIIGVAGGSQCTTSVNADIPVNTPNLLYSLRGKVRIPVGVEGGGVGTHLMTAFSLGAAFLCKPGEIGISFEGAGGRYMLKDGKGNHWMLYGGEASDSAKWWVDSLDDLGRPRFVEGETGLRKMPAHHSWSMTGNIHRLREQLAIGLVFQRAESISQLHERDCANIVHVTPEASALSRPYAR